MEAASNLQYHLDSVTDFLGPWWVEVCFIIFFAFGYRFIRLDFFGGKEGVQGKTHAGKALESTKGNVKIEELHNRVKEEVIAGDMIGALKFWRKAQAQVASSPDTLRLVVQALTSASPDTLVEEVAAHLEAHRAAACNTQSALAVLDTVGHGQTSEVLDEVCGMLRTRLAIPMNYQLYEALLAGHAFAGNDERVDDICQEISDIGQKRTARAYALIIKGFLCHGNLDAGLKHTQAMRKQGFYVPPFAVGLLFRIGSESERLKDVFEVCLESGISLPHETVCFAFEDCLKRSDCALAATIEAAVRAGGDLPHGAFDPLLKVNVVAGHSHALELWEEMQALGVKLTEGLCVGVLARSAESKHLRFAEEVTKYCRDRNLMTIALYSALMKVYAYCGFFGRACDLYPEILEKGLVPDKIMYGCLMRFAVECGRTELSQELSHVAPQLDVQNYMSLIRAAGRDKDVERAFGLLQQLTATGEKVDLAAYNCVLDACVCAGDLTRARELAEDMRARFGRLDIVTYNTLLKGFTTACNLKDAYALLREMEQDGVGPNDISYNSIINAAVCKGNFKEAWGAIEEMESKGIKADHYTVSIMLKALKRFGGSRESTRVLAMVDRLGVNVCQEEVLLNTLIEVCMHLGQTKRLQDLLALYDRSGNKPSQHLYGALIKSCSQLKRMNKCKEYWQDMVVERAMQPNDIVLGCMLDALVCNGLVGEAVDLFKEWKPKVGANMVMYSTLAKGFAVEGRAREAMEMWRGIQAEGAPMNTVVYNALIDAQARKGATAEVADLFAGMVVEGIKPDAITYSTMVKAHCVNGDMNKALEVLAEMQAVGLVKDCIVFNTILDWCTKSNRMDIADRVLQEFNELQIAPSNFTVGILIKMYGRRRMLDKAFAVAREMPEKWGFKANPQVFTCLISACFLNNNLDRAFQVFQELRENGADFKSYNVIIGGCLKAGKVQEAAELIEDAYGLNGKERVLPHGQNISPETLESVMHALGQRGLAEKVGFPLIANLRAAKVPVNGRLMTSAFDVDVKFPPRQQGRGRQGIQGKARQQDKAAAA